jgi:hypothetical protein
MIFSQYVLDVSALGASTDVLRLQPGKLSSVLWTIGCPLLHTGVVVKRREYAFGGHDRSNITGVYFTKPRHEPPGGTFRVSLLAGCTVLPLDQIDEVIADVSKDFLGPGYNLLTKNCNHFTAELVRKLTGKAPPRWLNRAASIGVALPCVVPREWIEVPDYDEMGGELVEDPQETNENSGMIRQGDVERWRNEMDRIGRTAEN